MSYHSRVFKSGNSLTIRIPKAFHLSDQQEIEITLKNNVIMIRILPKNLGEAFLSLPSFSK